MFAQSSAGGDVASRLENPIGFVEAAAQAVPGMDGSTSAPISIVLLLTVLTLAPAILILCTSFTRFVVVLGLLRQAIGTQGLPPSQVVVGLSLFLTFVATPWLDDKHSIFGEVVGGAETLKALEERGSESGQTREALEIRSATITVD